MRRCQLFLSDVGFNLLSIGVIVRQGGVNLSESQMRIFEGNFFRGHAHLVPAYEAKYRQSGTSYFRPSAAYSGFPFDQRTDFHAQRQGLSLPLSLVAS